LTERIIGLAIEVHRKTGPGLLESVYAARLCFELEHDSVPLSGQVSIPVTYKGMSVPLGFRADILLDDIVILEIKAAPALLPAHDAQLQTYTSRSLSLTYHPDCQRKLVRASLFEILENGGSPSKIG
jgi:GxxExxY protein